MNSVYRYWWMCFGNLCVWFWWSSMS